MSDTLGPRPTRSSNKAGANVSYTIGSGVGPYLMGLGFDRTHSYNIGLGTFCVMLIAASAIISRLGPYEFPAKATDPAIR
jgi:cyanate permease